MKPGDVLRTGAVVTGAPRWTCVMVARVTATALRHLGGHAAAAKLERDVVAQWTPAELTA